MVQHQDKEARGAWSRVREGEGQTRDSMHRRGRDVRQQQARKYLLRARWRAWAWCSSGSAGASLSRSKRLVQRDLG